MRGRAGWDVWAAAQSWQCHWQLYTPPSCSPLLPSCHYPWQTLLGTCGSHPSCRHTHTHHEISVCKNIHYLLIRYNDYSELLLSEMCSKTHNSIIMNKVGYCMLKYYNAYYAHFRGIHILLKKEKITCACMNKALEWRRHIKVMGSHWLYKKGVLMKTSLKHLKWINM